MANWTPADLGSNLLVWLDASDAATITAVAGNVSSWNDKSGSGRAFFQNNTPNQPPYVGGKVQIYDQKALSATSSFGNAYDFFVIGKSVGAGKYHSLILAGGGSYVAFLIDPSDLVGIWTDTFHQVVSFTWAADTEAFVYTANSTPLNTTKMAKNGGSLTEIGTTVPDLTFYSIGQASLAQGFGDLYELIVVTFNSPLDTRQKLEGYAAWKWGLQGLLPSGHPYKAAPPSTGVADQNIVGTGIASTNAFGTASLSRGAVNISAAGIASTNTFGTAAVAVSIDVVLLCHFDHAFVDASSYAHTLTPAGLTIISAANQKFGAGSAFYNIGNATSSISTNNSADFHFGAAPFTIEAWCYATQAGTGDGYNPILAEWDAVLGNVSFFFNVFPAYQFFWSPDGTAYSYLNAAPSALPLNTWTHVAADRDSSGVLRIYVNGVVVASVSCPDSFYPSTYTCMIGNDASAGRAFPGYLDELRVVRGTAMYGGPFTPPTAPFLPPDSAGALNIAPTGIASTTAFGTASVSPGAVNITATGIVSTTAFGTASLTLGAVNIAATGIASTTAFGTASLSPGALNISATGIGSTTAFGTAALLGRASLSPFGIASTTAFGNTTIASGVGAPRSISPTGIASTNVFGNSSIRAGALTPRALISPHGNICCDPAYRPLRGPQTLQQVHFRPAKPYPRYILGPGIGVSAAGPSPARATVTIATPPQAGRFTIRGPSSTGPWTYRDSQGTYPVFRPGGVGT